MHLIEAGIEVIIEEPHNTAGNRGSQANNVDKQVQLVFHHAAKRDEKEVLNHMRGVEVIRFRLSIPSIGCTGANKYANRLDSHKPLNGATRGILLFLTDIECSVLYRIMFSFVQAVVYSKDNFQKVNPYTETKK